MCKKRHYQAETFSELIAEWKKDGKWREDDMSDAELIALAAVVNQQTVLMDATNRFRERNGNGVAYTDDQYTHEWWKLVAELERRGTT